MLVSDLPPSAWHLAGILLSIGEGRGEQSGDKVVYLYDGKLGGGQTVEEKQCFGIQFMLARWHLQSRRVEFHQHKCLSVSQNFLAVSDWVHTSGPWGRARGNQGLVLY